MDDGFVVAPSGNSSRAAFARALPCNNAALFLEVPNNKDSLSESLLKNSLNLSVVDLLYLLYFKAEMAT